MNYLNDKNLTTINNSYKISWTDVNLFLQCPRCFYNKKKLDIWPPTIDENCFKLPKAVDENLKKEFDIYRKKQEPHPIMVKYGIEAIPFNDINNSIERWRNPRHPNGRGGIKYYDQILNLDILGGVDDVWVNNKKELILVEYKSTSAEPGTTIEDHSWYKGYKLQLAFYKLILQKSTLFNICSTGYFIYCNGLIENFADTDYGNSLKFETTLTKCELDDSLLKKTLLDIYRCLNQSKVPPHKENCKYCKYALRVKKIYG